MCLKRTVRFILCVALLLNAFLLLFNILRGSEQEGRFPFRSIKCLTQNVKMCVQANSKSEDKTSCVPYSEDQREARCGGWWFLIKIQGEVFGLVMYCGFGLQCWDRRFHWVGWSLFICCFVFWRNHDLISSILRSGKLFDSYRFQLHSICFQWSVFIVFSGIKDNMKQLTFSFHLKG